VVRDDGILEFNYRSRPGEQVSIMGNFNNWDPFMHRMVEDRDEPGLYTLRMPLPEGPVYYLFVVGTQTLLDPLNARRAWDRDRQEVSYLQHQ